jgi:DNA-binding LacI/PurR family transcriptional regulator
MVRTVRRPCVTGARAIPCLDRLPWCSGGDAATRERLAAAAELGYRPDDRARMLRSRSSKLIGITLTAVHPFHVEVTEALHQAANLRGYQLSLSWTTPARSLLQAVDMLLAQRCAAVIHIGPTAPEKDMAELVELAPDVPTVVLDRHLDIPGIRQLGGLATLRAALRIRNVTVT